MQKIEIRSINGVEILEQLHVHLKGKLSDQWGEHVLEFDNDFGKGKIRSIGFDWGVSLVDYNVRFNTNTKMEFAIGNNNPIAFIFISDGELGYDGAEDKSCVFERYQNIILSTQKLSKEAYVFPKNTTVAVNFIYVLPREYTKKKNNNLSYLSKSLLAVFKDENKNAPYKHYGNYNLKIADQIRRLQESNESGIIRTLSIEGQLNLIMAMQMLEHTNYENDLALPESISKVDINNVHKLTGYISDNISESLSVQSLAARACMSPNKLQLGFNILYSKSVNEYIRELKLELSRDYIRNTDDTISEITYKIGLKSRSYFSKIFFNRYGLLPIEYRKKNKLKE